MSKDAILPGYARMILSNVKRFSKACARGEREIIMNIGMVEIFSVIIFFISFYGLITSKNIIKSIASIGIMEIAIIMFFLGLGYTSGMKPPIGASLEYVADPLPQALVITTIIIGITVSAVNLSMLITLCRQFKAADWDIIEKKSSE